MGKICAILLFSFLTWPAIADECDAQAAAVVRETGATFNRRSSVKIFLSRPPLKELSVDCAPQIGLQIAWPGEMPPAMFFELAGKAAQIVTGVSAATIAKGAIKCHGAALRNSDGDGEVQAAGVDISCDTDGSETIISVHRSTD